MSAAVDITIRRPDDWHVHLRDGDILKAVLPYTAAQFGRAVVMPNLKPPVTTIAQAASYRSRIQAAIPAGLRFEPLMTCYLTDATDPAEIARGFSEQVWVAAKLYPAGATTNSHFGVTDISRIYPVLETMQRIGMPLLVHGEVTDREVDIFDREQVFIDLILSRLLRDFPELKVVLEHITTAQAVDFVSQASGRLAATITPHHLMINRSSIFEGGVRPHLYCLPVAKREHHRLALRLAATSGAPRFFLGTDTAPHLAHTKEAACGCAGIFNAPTAMQSYAQVFHEEGALDRLEAFASLNGPRFYGLPANADRLRLRLQPKSSETLPDLAVGDDRIAVFASEMATSWQIETLAV
ncbi:dihydroorotase [Ferrovibrio sp.]|uniref:dihydroorotase n=1 Tax=Ferrovibrio sp. TaxID=1917215 RepID=UPI000CB020B6|nr:dihydroorotase [Ferrovibrio sp.]PJI43498.1 MAG: dihydroorotase [Ferrovibrio sp.]